MFLSLIPLYYQLLSAYRPQADISSTPQVNQPPISTPVPTPTGTVLGMAVGGEGQVVTVAVLGDSMIDTLGTDLLTLKKSLADYFPTKVFRLLNYGLGASNIESGLSRLTNSYQNHQQEIPSLISQKPDIVVIESFAYNNYGNTQTGIDKHKNLLNSIISKINQELPNTKIILATAIAPNSIIYAKGVPNLNLSSLDRIERTKTIRLYQQNTIEFARSKNLPLAAASEYSLENDSEGRIEYIDPIDRLHPSALGAKLFADTLADTIHLNKLLE